MSSRRLPGETIRQIAASSDIVAVVDACVPLHRTGATFTSLCPFHQEKTPSFVVMPARQSFKCFGCGVGGDVFDFVALWESISFPEAVRCLAAQAGIPIADEGTSTTTRTKPRPKPLPPAAPATPARPLRLPPDLRPCTRAEVQAVAGRRGLSVEGVALASNRGLLWQGSPRGLPAWIVADAARINAQARRMDGGRWEHIGGKKAYTLPGARAGWSIGAREADALPFVVVTEGGPDLLAAHHFIVAEGREGDTAAVGMMGACNDFPEDALLLLAHKRVRIYPHLDPAGQTAAVRWTEQLERVGCEVDAFDFTGLRRADGEPVKDLNDLALVDADCFEAERAELERILPG